VTQAVLRFAFFFLLLFVMLLLLVLVPMLVVAAASAAFLYQPLPLLEAELAACLLNFAMVGMIFSCVRLTS
jgi:hypothetical protein